MFLNNQFIWRSYFRKRSRYREGAYLRKWGIPIGAVMLEYGRDISLTELAETLVSNWFEEKNTDEMKGE